MKKLIYIGILATLTFGCKKEEKGKEYDVTMTVTGEGTYKYQIGPESNSGTVNGTKTITSVAKTETEDYVEISAHQTGKFPIKITLDIPNVINNGANGSDPKLSKQLYKN